MTDCPSLFDYTVTTAPDMPQIGSKDLTVTVKAVPKKEYAQKTINLRYILADLKYGNGAENLTATTDGEPSCDHSPTNTLWDTEKGGKDHPGQFRILAPGDDPQDMIKPNGWLKFSISGIHVNDTPGTVQLNITEKSAVQGDDPCTSSSGGLTVTKYKAGTVFDSLHAVVTTGNPPKARDGSLVNAGEPFRLEWNLKLPPEYHQGPKDGPPYYTLTLGHDNESTDVTAHNSSYSGDPQDSLTLSHTTLFTLTLTLHNEEGEQSHTLSTLVIVSPTDITVGDLTAAGPASVLGMPSPVDADLMAPPTATTDGLLLCTVQTPGGTAGLTIKRTTAKGQELPACRIETHEPDPLETSCNTKILIPIPQGTTINITHSPAPQGATYLATFYPLGIGTPTTT